MLVRLTLIVGDEKVNCIISDRQIGNSLLFLEDGKTEVALFGNYNSKKQLVVKKVVMRNPTSFEKELTLRSVN